MIFDCRDKSVAPPYGRLFNADTGEHIPKPFFFNTETGEYRHYVEDEKGNILLDHKTLRPRKRAGRARLRFVPFGADGQPDETNAIEMPAVRK